jgi:hypothetical protein
MMQDNYVKYKETRCQLNEYLNQSETDRIKRQKILSVFDNDKKLEITFDDLKVFKVGERAEVNDGVFFEKTYEDKNKMTFLTYMIDGGTFGIHLHDCWEFCKILKGNLIEKQRGYKRYSEGETVSYSKGEEHTPYATQDSVYEVHFYKSLI